MVVSPILGVLAGVMSVANTVPYVRDVGAVGTAGPSLLLYPLYFCAVNGAIAVLIAQRRARVAAV
jgi:hypothetical protein